MLVRLNKQEIHDRWEKGIRTAVESSLPPIAGNKEEERLQRIWNNLMLGTMQCWCNYSEKAKEVLNGIGLTTFTYDLCSGAKFLLIYTAFSVAKTDPDDWVIGYQTLADFAIEHDCERVCCYTQEEKIVKNAKAVGATGFAYMLFPPLMKKSQ